MFKCVLPYKVTSEDHRGYEMNAVMESYRGQYRVFSQEDDSCLPGICYGRQGDDSQRTWISKWGKFRHSTPHADGLGWSDRREGREFDALIKRAATNDRMTSVEKRRLDELTVLRREILAVDIPYEVVAQEQAREQAFAEIVGKIDAYISRFGVGAKI